MKCKLIPAVLAISAMVLMGGCDKTKPIAAQVSNYALTAPVLAYALDDVYGVLIAAKAIPDHRTEATKALASLDAISPFVHAQGAAIAGDQFNWASFVIQAAIAAVKLMGIWV